MSEEVDRYVFVRQAKPDTWHVRARLTNGRYADRALCGRAVKADFATDEINETDPYVCGPCSWSTVGGWVMKRHTPSLICSECGAEEDTWFGHRHIKIVTLEDSDA